MVSDENAILEDFLDEAQRLQSPTEANPERGWDYELRLGNWLAELYEEYGPPTERHQALESALRSIFEQENRDDILRFSAFYCYAMHLWNANRLSDHKTLLQDMLDDFDDNRFLLIRHRRAMDYLSRALTSGEHDQRRSNSESALEESAKCLESVTIRNLENKGELGKFARILMPRGVLHSYAREYQRARSDAARARSLEFQPKHEDELSHPLAVGLSQDRTISCLLKYWRSLVDY